MFKYKAKDGALAKARAEKCMSMHDLSMATKITPQGLYYVESGKKNPRASTVKAIAGALDKEVKELFEIQEG